MDPANTILNLAEAEPDDLKSVAYQYVSALHKQYMIPGGNSDDWQALTDDSQITKFEYARWLDPRLIEEILGDSLKRTAYIDSPDLSETEQVAMILRRKGDVVARLDEGRRFVDLVDRRAIVERITPEAARQISA